MIGSYHWSIHLELMIQELDRVIDPSGAYVDGMMVWWEDGMMVWWYDGIDDMIRLWLMRLWLMIWCDWWYHKIDNGIDDMVWWCDEMLMVWWYDDMMILIIWWYDEIGTDVIIGLMMGLIRMRLDWWDWYWWNWIGHCSLVTRLMVRWYW